MVTVLKTSSWGFLGSGIQDTTQNHSSAQTMQRPRTNQNLFFGNRSSHHTPWATPAAAAANANANAVTPAHTQVPSEKRRQPQLAFNPFVKRTRHSVEHTITDANVFRHDARNPGTQWPQSFLQPPGEGSHQTSTCSGSSASFARATATRSRSKRALDQNASSVFSVNAPQRKRALLQSVQTRHKRVLPKNFFSHKGGKSAPRCRKRKVHRTINSMTTVGDLQPQSKLRILHADCKNRNAEEACIPMLQPQPVNTSCTDMIVHPKFGGQKRIHLHEVPGLASTFPIQDSSFLQLKDNGDAEDECVEDLDMKWQNRVTLPKSRLICDAPKISVNDFFAQHPFCLESLQNKKQNCLHDVSFTEPAKYNHSYSKQNHVSDDQRAWNCGADISIWGQREKAPTRLPTTAPAPAANFFTNHQQQSFSNFPQNPQSDTCHASFSSQCVNKQLPYNNTNTATVNFFDYAQSNTVSKSKHLPSTDSDIFNCD